jgi:serine protease
MRLVRGFCGHNLSGSQPASLLAGVFTAWLATAATLALAQGPSQTPAPRLAANASMWVGAPVAPLASVGSAAKSERALGLIVRLKDGVPHSLPHAQQPQENQIRQRDTERWRGVLRASALTGTSGQREPALRAGGRDHQLLDFGRVLTGDEAERMAARLRQRPEVDWVAPNTFERRLQVAAAASTTSPNTGAPQTAAGQAIGNDPLAPQQWWLKPAGGSSNNAAADRLRGVPGFAAAWASGLAGATGHAGAVVAVLDTGITPHPDLIGRVLPGYDFVSDPALANDGNGRDNDPSDPGDWVSAADRQDPRFAGCDEQRSSWHGTVIAGLLAATPDNGLGVVGINRQGRVLPVRVAGKCGASVADIVDGMRWAGGLPVPGVPANPHPARIINISFGGSAACGREYQSTIDELRAKGVVVVAAAGNGHGAASRPASCAGVVGVAALNRDGFKTHYSNFGAALAGSGVATTGGDDSKGGAWRQLLGDGGVVTVWNNGATAPGVPEYAAVYGTSFAAPLVAGTLSLMLSVNPALTADQMVAGLRASARPHVLSHLMGVCTEANPGRCICTTQTCGAGILDAEQALQYAANPGGYAAPNRSAALVDSDDVRMALALGPDLPPNAGAADTGTVVAGTSTGNITNSATEGVRVGGGGASSVQWTLALLAAALLLCAVQRRLPVSARKP